MLLSRLRPAWCHMGQRRAILQLGSCSHLRILAWRPRFDPKVTPGAAALFANLILLCRAHHLAVDCDPVRYSSRTLQTWKTQSEFPSHHAMAKREDITQDSLQQVVTDSYRGPTRHIDEAVSQLEREVQVRLQDDARQFEAVLQRAVTEHALLEMKQGFCRLNDPGRFDEDSFAKILRTASAMANVGRGQTGLIVIGVADDSEDAASIERYFGVVPYEFSGFFVTGTAHELSSLNRQIDEQFRWLTDAIFASKLEPGFARSLAATLTPFRYRGFLLWRMEPLAGEAPVSYDGKFYERIGPRTVEVGEPYAIIDLVRRFS